MESQGKASSVMANSVDYKNAVIWGGVGAEETASIVSINCVFIAVLNEELSSH